MRVKLEDCETFDPDGLSCPVATDPSTSSCLFSAESEEDLRSHLLQAHQVVPCAHCRLFCRRGEAMEVHVIREHSG